MSSVIASGITQTLPLFSTGKPNASAQEEKVASPSTAALTKESRPAPADTISISSQLRQTINDVKKEPVKKVETSKENSGEKSDEVMPKVKADKENSNEKPDGVMSKVQFTYDMKGDLSVRYMDASNHLIYQVPSELMLRLKEAESKSESSVNTKA